MNITTVSHRFPTKHNPAQGKIIKDELDLIKDEVNVTFVNSAVKAPFFLSQSARSSELVDVDYTIVKAPYWSIPRRKFPSITQTQIAKALLKAIPENTDIVHLHWIHPNGLAVKALKNAGYKVVLSIHGSDWTKNHDKSYFKPLIREMFDYADLVITVGSKLRQNILSEYPDIDHKLKVVFHGINTDLFSLPESNSKNNDSRFKLLSVANIDYVKGIDVLIEALQELPSDLLKSVDLTIISALTDPDYKAKCIQIIKKYRLADHITFLEKLPQEELVHHYHNADLFILPSRSEAFGLALAEAMATGLPCISTYSGGPEDIITSKEQGLLVEAGNPNALSNAINHVLKNKELFSPEKIRQAITQNFSLSAKKRRILSLYHKAINVD